MKKITLIFLLSLILAFSLQAQTKDTPEQAALTELSKSNAQIIALYKQKNYDEALKIASVLLNTIEKNGLVKDLRVLPIFNNIAEIYLAKGKESEAVALLQKELEAYQANSADTRLPVAKITYRIAEIYFLKKDYGKAEDFFLKALNLREKLDGAESREVVKINVDLGNTYREKQNFEKAQEFYLKSIRINDKILSEEEKDKREDLSNYECFLYHKAFQKNRVKDAAAEISEFNKQRNIPEAGTVRSGIVNGKALNLYKPAYPSNIGGANGFALVRVTIDETGNVISAKATCGIIEFVEVVEDAARKSKFTPTTVSGKPVKVTGIIVYNFVR